MAGRIGSGILTLRGGVLLAIRPRRQTINHASETTTSRTTRPPETKDQLLRVAATARVPFCRVKARMISQVQSPDCPVKRFVEPRERRARSEHSSQDSRGELLSTSAV